MDDTTKLLILELREELLRQWEYNHSEHCGKTLTMSQHKGVCRWPLPALLNDIINKKAG